MNNLRNNLSYLADIGYEVARSVCTAPVAAFGITYLVLRPGRSVNASERTTREITAIVAAFFAALLFSASPAYTFGVGVVVLGGCGVIAAIAFALLLCSAPVRF